MMDERIRLIDEWLDTATSQPYLDSALSMDWARIAKIGEEFGEVVSEFILCTGQNPRKGWTTNIDPVLEELADVVLTALCAIQHFTKHVESTVEIVDRKIEHVFQRTLSRKDNRG